MNQPNITPGGQNKLVWFVIVFGALFFLMAVSMFRPARHSTVCAANPENNINGRWNYCIDPGIARPPANLRAYSNGNSQPGFVPRVPPPPQDRGFVPPRRQLTPGFRLPAIDLTPIWKALLLLIAISALPLLHGWLLGQAWRYMFPLDEADKAMRMGWRVSAGLTLFAIPVLVLGLTHTITDPSLFLTAIACIAVTTGAAVSIRTARRREFTDTFTRKLAVVTGALSLIVPAGAAALVLSGSGSFIGMWTWPIIATLVLGFILYRGAINEYLDRLHALATRWQIDHLAVEIPVFAMFILLPVVWLFGDVAGYIGSSPTLLDWTLILLMGGIFLTGGLILALPFVGVWLLSACVSGYVTWRGRGLPMKKKGSPLELHDTSLFEDKKWFGLLFRQTLIWLGSSVVVSAFLLIAERAWLR